MAIVLVILFRHAQFKALYEMYWSQPEIEKLFYEDLGLGKSWSAFIAVVGSFIYGLAWVPLSMWTYRVLVWRFNATQLAVAFVCWVFVYGHVPFLHAVLGTDTCFNQRTGDPTKWYVQDSDGRLVLSDSPGFDSATGVAKKPVTTEICTASASQKKNDKPRRITVDIRQIEFFDAYTGRARVWYAKSGDGPYELFDAYGYHPTTSEPLHAVSKDVVVDIMKRLADEQAARLRAEEERKLAEEELRKRSEQERARAEAEALRRAEAARAQAELDARSRAEEQRQRDEAAAKKRADEERRQAAESLTRAEVDRKQAEIDAQKRAAEAKRQAEEELRQAEVAAKRQLEQEQARARAVAEQRAEEQRILSSYRRVWNGQMCRNVFKDNAPHCECSGDSYLYPWACPF
jgi:hypothetical protein